MIRYLLLVGSHLIVTVSHVILCVTVVMGLIQLDAIHVMIIMCCLVKE